MNELRTMHLFAGIGGGLLADLILGHRPIVAVEWDKYACKVLRERASEGWFPDLRVWEGDVRMFDPSEYAGKVDCIHAGFPCQDISVAGKQAGVGAETRSGLYREVLRIAGVVRPRYLFFENVAAIVTNGLGAVISDITALGYDAEWICLRASDCGANHHRDRWWLLAHARYEGVCERGQLVNAVEDVQYGAGIYGDGLSRSYGEETEVLVHPNGKQWGASGMGQNAQSDWWHNTGRCGEMVPDTECIGLQGQGEFVNAKYPASCGNWEATEPVHGCFGDFWRIEPGLGQLVDGVPNRVCQSGEGINANASKNSDRQDLQNYWEVEPDIGRVATGISNRVGQLKGYGNAQVPLQAATAWKLLGGP